MCLLPRRAHRRLPQCQGRSHNTRPGYVGEIYGDDILYHPSLEAMDSDPPYRSRMLPH